MNDIGYHEPVQELSEYTRSLHRVLRTVMEELEAVDWYQQRTDVTSDDDLKAVLIHNRDEEIEHAAMALEWLRRHVPKVNEMFRTYLFTEDPIVDIEEADQQGADQGDASSQFAPDSDLGIGKLALDEGE